jgi:hypothetical protein
MVLPTIAAAVWQQSTIQQPGGNTAGETPPSIKPNLISTVDSDYPIKSALREDSFTLFA